MEWPTVQTRVDTAFANQQLYILFSQDAFGDPLYALMQGSQVQHDTMPLYLFGQAYSDIESS